MNNIITNHHNKLALNAIVTSHSIDGTFEFCPRRFEFAHVWTQQPEGGLTGFAAEVGTALHEAVQAWARLALMPGRDSHNRNEMALAFGLQTLLRWWPWTLEEVSLEDGKTGIKQRSLGEAIILYDKITANPLWDQWELLPVDDFGLSIEIPWRISYASLGTIPLPQGGLGYLCRQGKIDFVLRNRFTGEIRVFDLKTTVKEKRAHEAMFKFSGQGSDYALIIASVLGFDWREHGLKMSYIVANFASADGSEDSSVELRTYDYSPADVEDGLRIKQNRLEQMHKYATEQWWPRRSHGCDSFGNPCPYMGICSRRDNSFIKKWFAFEPFSERTRIYEPIWDLTA